LITLITLTYFALLSLTEQSRSDKLL